SRIAPALATLSIALAGALAACAPPPGPAASAATALPPRGGAAAAPAPLFELVETVPIETTLDHPELRDAADVWLAMIGAARSSIDLGQFYASNHQPSRLEPVVAALEAAIARGVRVRFFAEQGF